jgi:hypothetical protein
VNEETSSHFPLRRAAKDLLTHPPPRQIPFRKKTYSDRIAPLYNDGSRWRDPSRRAPRRPWARRRHGGKHFKSFFISLACKAMMDMEGF